MGGAFTGGMMAAIKGQNIWKGMRGGALAGMATSSVVWGYRSYQTEQFIENNVDCGSDGCTDKQLNAIKDAGQSPSGQRVMGEFINKNETLNLFPEYASPYGYFQGPHVDPGTNNMYYDGDPQNSLVIDGNGNIVPLGSLAAQFTWGATVDPGNAFVHELGHTVAGEGLLDFPVGANVAYNENPYRMWMGQPSRGEYNWNVPVHPRPALDQLLYPWR